MDRNQNGTHNHTQERDDSDPNELGVSHLDYNLL